MASITKVYTVFYLSDNLQRKSLVEATDNELHIPLIISAHAEDMARDIGDYSRKNYSVEVNYCFDHY